MANVTLLDIVQRLLSDMDSDAVNSISETIEATQVAHVVRDAYSNVIAEHPLYAKKKIFQLEAVSDPAKPSFMKIPEGYHSIEWVNYDKRVLSTDNPAFGPVLYVEPEEFIRRVNGRAADDSSVDTCYDYGGATLFILNDKAPSYYTSFDNNYLVFDSYNSNIEATLMESKTQAYGQITDGVTLADNAVIDLPPHLMQLLVNEAREVCFDYYKDGAPRKVRQIAGRTRVRAQRTDHFNRSRDHSDSLPDYGRRPRR